MRRKFFIFWSILAKCFLETINYIEHYGLVRAEGEPVLPKHSWNSNHMISSTLLFNLTRHSAHHEKSNLPFWKLEPYKDAPMLPNGYLSMLYFILLFDIFENFTKISQKVGSGGQTVK